MKRKILAGTTSLSLPVVIYDNTSTTGAGLSGVTHSSSGLVFEYRRQGQSSWTSVTPVSKTLGTYTSGGIVASGSRAGRYEIDIPDAAVAAGARFVEICLRGVTNMHPVDIEIELDAVNYQDSTRFGLGAIPNVVQGNSGALPTGDASGRVTVIANQDKTGYSLTQTFPANFSALSIDGSGQINSVGVVDELGPNALLANDLANEIATAVGNLQAISRLDSMIESNGAGQFRFDTIALSMAPGGGGGGGDPWTTDISTGYVLPQAGAVLYAVKSKTDLITSGNVQTALPVTAAGQIASPLVIGDDYLNANGRAFSWTIALPTGYSVGSSTCKFGMRYEDSQGVNEFIVSGTVIDAGGGNVTLRFDVSRTTTGTLRPGWYDWSVEIASATAEITPVKSGKNAEWQYKQT